MTFSTTNVLGPLPRIVDDLWRVSCAFVCSRWGDIFGSSVPCVDDLGKVWLLLKSLCARIQTRMAVSVRRAGTGALLRFSFTMHMKLVM